MKTQTKKMLIRLRRWLRLEKKRVIQIIKAEPALRAELFSVEQMERHGAALALAHQLIKAPGSDVLLRRLAENEEQLIMACRTLMSNPTVNNRITPAGEWLLDNFYLIEEQIRTAKRHFPKRYGRELPQLALGPSRGYPRVYDMALQNIVHGDGRWDPENLSRFVSAYQSVSVLTLGELWAIPIMLRLALIENLRRVSTRVIAEHLDRALADHWADQMLKAAASDPKKLILIIADMARSNPPMSSAFVAELTRRLQGAALALPLTWVEQRLAEEGLTIEQQVLADSQYQATNQVTVSNSIASLRRLGEVDWREFVETMSVVNHLLMTDPAGTFGRMDFATRDRYRHVVEDLARRSKKSEQEVVTTAIELAKSAADTMPTAHRNETADPRLIQHKHVGFYLIGSGIDQLERAVETHTPLWKRLRRFSANKPGFCYLGLIALFTAGLTYYLLEATATHVPLFWLILLTAASAFGVSQLVVAVINWATTLLIEPHLLPRMDFSHGIPTQYRTLVVVPTMLSSPESIAALVEALEVRFLGNRDESLHFALLTDFSDAAEEHTDADDALLALARDHIEALNRRYPGKSTFFFLFHRPRHWNPAEQVWMGYERKRGKLGDLNALLCGEPDAASRFSLIVGDVDWLGNIKYVITLDSDTQLPRDSAREFIATMAHPLNWPRYDETSQRVVAGYGILQPRIAEALPRPGPTRYARITGSEPGIDPYTRTVSDVYQDLFGEGSFIGKGIYDVHMFQQVLAQRFPENCILSHDLLEGCYLRSGLLSDVPLYEQSPGNYLDDVKRRRRWIRGDWQLAGWLLPRVLHYGSKRVANRLSALSRWKLFDNLRRSLAPAALLTMLALSWTVLPNADFWLGVVLTIILFPTIGGVLAELVRKPKEVSLRQHLVICGRVMRWRFAQLIIYIACLPHEAEYSLNAIIRTAWRVLISRRHLLEWTPSDQVDQRFTGAIQQWISALWAGPAMALLAVVALSWRHPAWLLPMAPLLLLWLVSPFIMRWLSQPFRRAQVKLSQAQIRLLHHTARKIWRFFETFVTAADHWLPPDNYQEVPVTVLAHRTSPTNIGLSLLANLTAFDFGYITADQLLERTAHAMRTMNGLERYRGHFYNWYDTQTLQPLLPRYISAVDSGNLVGHLLTLRQGLLALPDTALFGERYISGLYDTFHIVVETAKEALHTELTHLKHCLQALPAAFATWPMALSSCDELCAIAAQIITACQEFSEKPHLNEWTNAFLSQCQALRAELRLFKDVAELLSPAVTSLRDIAAISELPAATTEQLEAARRAKVRIKLIDSLAARASAFSVMDNYFLYDHVNYLLRIGYNVDEQRRDHSSYDLLASEARLASFMGIAQGQMPQESWFALGRLLLLTGGEPVLVSWSGSMFEYLMPMLVMPTYTDTLLDQTCLAAVNRQIEYGKQRGVPWGVSESGYNVVDAQLNYQYRAFGVPGLGLKRGLAEDLVVAPYATVMALMVAPEAACQNLQRLTAMGAAGAYGFYEAIDFTPSRVPRGKSHALVRSFMAHHQGMSFLSLSYLLHNQPMQRRFIADPELRATLLLLQERIPKPVASYTEATAQSIETINLPAPHHEASLRVFNHPDTAMPEVQLLSNGHYHLALTQAGGGYSRWKDYGVTRWREDGASDNWGLFSYLRDVDSGVFWSTTYQPTTGDVTHFRAVFSEGHAEFSRRDIGIETHTEIAVSPEDDIELRRFRIRNHSKVRRHIEFTSYFEVVLVPVAADQAHPAFSNLFVETEILPPQMHAVLATRRPRSKDERPPWLCHLLNVYSDSWHAISFETDRARFVGRGRTLAAPLAMLEPGALSNTAGAVLDPIVAARCQVTLEPGASITLDLITGVTETREQCIALIEKYHDKRLANRVFSLAWTHAQVLMRQLNASEADIQLYGQLASAIIYANPARRASAAILTSNRRGQSGLWSYAISGDLPIVLVHIESLANLELVRQLVQAHAYWRQKGLVVDLVILNEEQTSYRQELQDQIMSLVTAGSVTDRAGGIFVRMVDQMAFEDQVLLQTVAHVVLSDKGGTLAEQLRRRPANLPVLPPLNAKPAQRHPTSQLPAATQDLQFFNGLGGFTPKGDEYVIELPFGEVTPAPWANVLANPDFGTVVSESGRAYTWSENAHEFRLTPWNNDPIQDSSGEAFYLRDENTGQFWSVTALPARGHGKYQTRHGFGYSIFEHVEDGIHSELCTYVALHAPVKFSVLKVRNDSPQRQRLSATGYVEWVLGDLRSKTARYVITEITQDGLLLARNHYNTEFAERTAFFDARMSGASERSVTGDRIEFLGRNGSQQRPNGLTRTGLSGRVGAGLDPCGAIQIAFELAPGETREVVFILGAGQDVNSACALAARCLSSEAANTVLEAVRAYWQRTLSTLTVKTPDPALNLLTNGWLIYQVLSSRLWGRSGYYQSGGAFGFRDQLQDALALVQIDPQRLRAQIILCAEHQFSEGDVQHWWHPPEGRGVRTRCSDDYLWLPFAICRYVEATGDKAILDEMVTFLQGRPLNADEESYYDLPLVSGERATLYQHAVRAIENGLRFGQHGLPLMGSGDWNDGMNLVGEHGQGESVWLGFFLYTVLARFAPLARDYGDTAFAQRCEQENQQLQKHLEENGWDGEWYRRAYFDDGTPLGSAGNDECRIDAIAQSWSVLSGAAEPSRAKQAMASLNQYLVRRQDALVQLLEPPFSGTALNPGYIKGYVPGVRENGGQYTHGAVWAAMAFAELGEKQLAWEVFNIINPINHGRTEAEINTYKTEPYVIAADVYGVAPHIGRGGWSWYTGSAAWMYRLITESLLGLRLEQGNQLRLKPCLPADWPGYSAEYRYGETVYHITVNQGSGEPGITLDGQKIEGDVIPLLDDGKVHQVKLE